MILYHSELNSFYSCKDTCNIYWEGKSNEFKKTYDANTYNLKLDGTIVNYNKGYDNHIIAGITCNKNRYVFNSWKHAEHKYTKACSLIKYNWNLRSNDEFTLDRIKCRLKNIDPFDLTFFI